MSQLVTMHLIAISMDFKMFKQILFYYFNMFNGEPEFLFTEHLLQTLK